MCLGGQRQDSAALLQGKRPGTPCIRGWVEPRAGLGWGVRKIWPPPGYNPQTEQLVASRYTNYAIPSTPKCMCNSVK